MSESTHGLTEKHPVEEFAARALAYAHHEDNWLHSPKDQGRHAEILRFKYREHGWKSAMTFWYTVEVLPSGVWRHLSIHMSQPDLAQLDAEMLAREIDQYKVQFLELLSPMVALFFPLRDEVATRFDVGTPIPVQDPRNKQVTLRVPMTFHFFVPWSTDAKQIRAHRPSNVATSDPRMLGWRPGEEPPAHTDPVLAWHPSWFNSGFAICWRDGDVWETSDAEQLTSSPAWWKELTPPE